MDRRMDGWMETSTLRCAEPLYILCDGIEPSDQIIWRVFLSREKGANTKRVGVWGGGGRHAVSVSYDSYATWRAASPGVAP